MSLAPPQDRCNRMPRNRAAHDANGLCQSGFSANGGIKRRVWHFGTFLAGNPHSGAVSAFTNELAATILTGVRSPVEKVADKIRRIIAGASMSNRHIAFALLTCASLAGCGVLAEPEIVSGDANEVAIEAGTYMNPAELAEIHCKDHGKSPILTNVEDPEILGSESIFYFDCR